MNQRVLGNERILIIDDEPAKAADQYNLANYSVVRG